MSGVVGISGKAVRTTGYCIAGALLLAAAVTVYNGGRKPEPGPNEQAPKRTSNGREEAPAAGLASAQHGQYTQPDGPALLRRASDHLVGPERDAAKAVVQLRQAAENGYHPAQYNLALLLLHGNGVDKDVAEALYWLRQSASQGNPAAQYVLGVALWTGGGAIMDRKSALAWLDAAARAGHAQAAVFLGTVYFTGDGVAKDPLLAARLFQYAADRGDAEACHNLAELFSHGVGVPLNTGTAQYYYKQADRLGFKKKY